ncbi:FAD-dependent monooxygenase [Hyphomonas sp. WL0036]|uniref:FAD-dependent monooxygenase n=1 Tax=Hyphomonas sediminis TaxID=2866160 RepID=UPI001C80835C|nr:FAD-dependent monooxygenase [Hyphomonas sediminis]MBY9068153.1 FAD-dependent monooxygenase [Hyphomonas sediminis]
MKFNQDVLIIGGGPVGLSLSIQLSRLGIRHMLIERNTEVSPHPKSRLLNPRSIEILRLWGLEDDVRNVRVSAKPTFYFGNDLISAWRQVFRPAEVLSDEISRSVSPCEVEGVLCSQDVLEPILRAAATSYETADIRFGWNAEIVSGLGQDGATTVGICDLANGVSETLNVRYLIAADGATSPIRTALGVETTGADRTLEAISVLFRSDLSKYGDTGVSFFVLSNPETIGTAVIAPVDEHGRAALLGRPKVMDEQPLETINWEEVLRLGVGVPDLPLEIIDVRAWRAAVVIANEYRRGNTFLVGDAAHLMPPNGGFNMNTGIQDAHNLAWKLAAVLQGWASEALLDTYDSERRPIALFNAAEAIRNLKALVDKDEDGRGGGFRQDHYVHPGLALGYRYNNGAVVYLADQDRSDNWSVGEYVQSPAPGARAPHLWLTSPSGQTISTLDLFEQNFVLLTKPETAAAWATAVNDAARVTGAPVKLITIGNGGDWNSTSGDFSALYDLRENEAVLVRPDGHIGWRGSAPDSDALTQAIGILTKQPEMAHFA